MKTLLCILLLSLSTTTTIRAQQAAGPAAFSAADDKAIRASVEQLLTNFRNHAFADMAAYTTPDVSWVNIVGMWWRGRPAVQAAHQQIFDAMFKPDTFTPGELTIRAVTPDVALVNLRTHVGAFYPPDGIDHGHNKQGDNDDLLTLVLVKQAGRWLLTAGHNTVVDARAAANNPNARPPGK
ncbi:SgcJ/EcaC family oxidoreductase [Hymenobacter actinosclerus]|uniref:SnoaL-like domain-containing protein n=1 Tax=Hymenobacter actinosclerus TaxID=82805 RepID=A0A1I0GJV7_9BACT|nr:SgcJ/EcaC family oxidoreductase [Hymenobacter actinosclerus]SET71229.1 conserved hypothetical protein [Hymenobacter actinosclerus]